jgi:putative Mg2+ transporter-C (MgtC) family protein
LPHVVLDPSRIAAQVVTGVGFLGAGSILLRGQAVRGLTTAASIWSVAALGLAAGGGLYFAAAVATGIILVILAGLKPLEEAYRARNQSYLVKVKLEPRSIDLESLKKALGVRGGQIKRLVTGVTEDGLEEQVINLTRVSRSDINKGVERLRAVAGVHAVEATRRGNAIADDDR